MTQQFPPHGKMNCTLCFSTVGETTAAGSWRFRNDPGYWGSSNPKVLVLGFSKGATQVNVYDRGRFEDVAFAGSRSRLKAVLVTLGLLAKNDNIENRFRADEKSFGFASLIRCSVARLDRGNNEPTTSGSIILRAFKESAPLRLLGNCSKQFLSCLPEQLRLVVMLGIQDGYIEQCRRLIGSLYSETITDINRVAYATDQVTWVHAAHPSGGNGWFGRWASSAPAGSPMGRKREFAIEAVRRITGLNQ